MIRERIPIDRKRLRWIDNQYAKTKVRVQDLGDFGRINFAGQGDCRIVVSVRACDMNRILPLAETGVEVGQGIEILLKTERAGSVFIRRKRLRSLDASGVRRSYRSAVQGAAGRL